MVPSFRSHRIPGLALALLLAASPETVRAQRDTIFFPANPSTRPAADSPRVPVRPQDPAGAAAPMRDQTFVPVPSLVGLTVEDARELLARGKLTLGALEEVVVSGVPGTIARQQPRAGARVAAGSAVPVWLVAARVAVMPAVMGLPRDRAERMVRQAGLRVGEVSGMADGPRVRVISHTFHAGERVPAGATVNLSLGVPRVPPSPVAQRDTPRTASPPLAGRDTPRAPPVQVARADSAAVPEVRAMGLSAARQALASAGFAAAFDPAFADSVGWMVAEQAPLPGARVPAGTPVRLALAPPATLAAPVVAAPAQPPPSTAPSASPAEPAREPASRPWALLGIGALLLLVAAAAAVRRMRGGKAAPPPTAVRARLRAEVRPRASVEGAPFGDAVLRMRVRQDAPAVRVAAEGTLFRANGGRG